MQRVFDYTDSGNDQRTKSAELTNTAIRHKRKAHHRQDDKNDVLLEAYDVIKYSLHESST